MRSALVLFLLSLPWSIFASSIPSTHEHQFETFATVEQCYEARKLFRQDIMDAAFEQTRGLEEQLNQELLEQGIDYAIKLRPERIDCVPALQNELGPAAIPATLAAEFILVIPSLFLVAPPMPYYLAGMYVFALSNLLDKVHAQDRPGLLQRLHHATENLLERMTARAKIMEEKMNHRFDVMYEVARPITGYTLIAVLAVERG